jgi:hypothetical protein
LLYPTELLAKIHKIGFEPMAYSSLYICCLCLYIILFHMIYKSASAERQRHQRRAFLIF